MCTFPMYSLVLLLFFMLWIEHIGTLYIFCSGRAVIAQVIVCSCTTLDLFFFYSTSRILNVHFYGMSKFNLEKSCDFLKIAKIPQHWVLHLHLISLQHFNSCDFRVLFFCPISRTFGMKVYLVGFYAANEFFFSRNFKFAGLQKLNTLPISLPDSTIQFPRFQNTLISMKFGIIYSGFFATNEYFFSQILNLGFPEIGNSINVAIHNNPRMSRRISL